MKWHIAKATGHLDHKAVTLVTCPLLMGGNIWIRGIGGNHIVTLVTFPPKQAVERGRSSSW